jgi:LruC domain-containing protein
MKNQRIIKIFKNSLTILLMGFALQVYSQPVFTDNVTDSVSITYPSIGASNPNFVYLSPTSLTFKWTSGNGTGRIVLASLDSTINAWPADKAAYTANASFGSGSSIGSAKVLYLGNLDSVTVTNLNSNAKYYFWVIEYTTVSTFNYFDTEFFLRTSTYTSLPDLDGDNVPDIDDAFPSDPLRAFITNNPTVGYGTLLFEDLWPGIGDYDFNDLVVDYNYSVVSNGDNNVVEADYTFVTRAIGGDLHNAFAFQLDGVQADKITTVTGTKTTGVTWTTFNANGTEFDQPNHANIIVFKDAYDLLPTTGGYWFVNVDPNAPDVGTDTTKIHLTFIDNGTVPAGGTLSTSIMDAAAFNPYIIVNQQRGKEIHLANRIPSDKANVGFFGTVNDNSIPGIGRYYKSYNNLPWALDINTSIPYTKEKVDFLQAYLNFSIWAQSNGLSNPDWYIDMPGNRNTSKLIIR